MQSTIASSVEGKEEMRPAEEDVFVDLPAPPGWKKKKFLPRTGTHKKNEIIFIAPTGEEISNRRQLEQFLKAHPRGLAASEFDWGTGETPRRSARISGKAKAIAPPEIDHPNKMKRITSASKKDKKLAEPATERTGKKESEAATEGDEEKETEAVPEGTGEPKSHSAAKKVEENVLKEEESEVNADDSNMKTKAAGLSEGNMNMVESESTKSKSLEGGLQSDSSAVRQNEKEEQTKGKHGTAPGFEGLMDKELAKATEQEQAPTVNDDNKNEEVTSENDGHR